MIRFLAPNTQGYPATPTNATSSTASMIRHDAVPREAPYAELSVAEKFKRFLATGKLTNNKVRRLKVQLRNARQENAQLEQQQQATAKQQQATAIVDIGTLEDFMAGYLGPHNNRKAIREKQDNALYHELADFTFTRLPTNFRPEYFIYGPFDGMITENQDGEVEYALAEMNAQSYDGTTTVPEPMHEEFMMHYYRIGESWMQEHEKEHPNKPFLGVFGGSGREGPGQLNSRGMTDKMVYNYKIKQGAGSDCEIMSGDYAVYLIDKEVEKKSRFEAEGKLDDYKPGEFWPRSKVMVNFYNEHLLDLIQKGVLTQGTDAEGRKTANLAGVDITHVMSDRLAYLLSEAKLPDAEGNASDEKLLGDDFIDNPPFKYCNITLREGNDKDITFTRHEEFNKIQRAKLGDAFKAAGFHNAALHDTIEKPELPEDLEQKAIDAFASFSKAAGAKGSQKSITVTRTDIEKGGRNYFKSLLPADPQLAEDAYLACKRISVQKEKTAELEKLEKVKAPADAAGVKVDVAFFKKLLVVDALAQHFAAACKVASDKDLNENGRNGDIVTKSTGTAKGAGVTGINRKDLDIAVQIFKQHIEPEVDPYVPEGHFGYPYAIQSRFKAHIVNGQVPENRLVPFPRLVDGKYGISVGSTIFKTGPVPQGWDKTYPVEIVNADGSVVTRQVEHLPKSNVGTADKKLTEEEKNHRDYLSTLAIAGCNLEHAKQFDVSKEMMFEGSKYLAGLAVYIIEENMRRLGIKPEYAEDDKPTIDEKSRMFGNLRNVDWSKMKPSRQLLPRLASLQNEDLAAGWQSLSSSWQTLPRDGEVEGEGEDLVMSIPSIGPKKEE